MFLKKEELIKLDFEQAAKLLEEGDVLLFRGDGIASFFIKRAGEGLYSHVGIASLHIYKQQKIWECIEFREWKGGRTINLKTYINSTRAKIDVYRPSSKKIVLSYNQETGLVEQKIVELDREMVTSTMRRMTGLPYGWKRILWMAQYKIPILRLLYSMESVVNDCCLGEFIYPVCSTAVAHSFSKAGYDLVHNRSDQATEPSDISRSALLNYLFTINDK